MDFVEKQEEFKQINECLSKIINLDIASECQINGIFKKEYLTKIEGDFDLILTEKFYLRLKDFSKVNSINQLYFYTLLPDPFSYYFYHFNKYSIIVFSQDFNPIEFLSLIHQQPTGGKADALMNISDIVVLFSKEQSWAIYLDRCTEQCVIGAKDSFILTQLETVVSG